MAIVKFHEKNVALFSKVSSGTADTFVSTDATPITTLDGGFTFDTAAFQFLGDALSRDEYTYQKDIYGELNAEIMQPILGTTSSAYDATTSNVTAADLFIACGGNFSKAPATGTTVSISYDNYTAVNSTVALEYRKSSGEDATKQNVYPMNTVNGTVDVSLNIGEIPKLKFSLKGNVASASSSTAISPEYGLQTSNVAPVMKKANIAYAKIVKVDQNAFTTGPAFTAIIASPTKAGHWQCTGSGLLTALGPVGSIRPIKLVQITGTSTNITDKVLIAEVTSDTTCEFFYPVNGTLTAATTVTKSIATSETLGISTLSASNFFGFDFTRYLTGVEEGFAKGATPTDVSITILEAPVGDTSYFIPNQTDVSTFYAVRVTLGTSAQSKVVYQWDKLQLSNLKEGKVGSYFGKDMTFRNTGKSLMMLI